MAKKNFLVIRSNAGANICAAEWTRLQSRVDFLLHRHHPDFSAELAKSGMNLEDRKCPRQEKPVRAEDMI